MKKGIFSNAKTLAFLGRENNSNIAQFDRCHNGMMSADDLENEAQYLSNFGGGAGYSGFGDDFLEFSGGSGGSFADPISRGKIYNLTLTNSSSSARLTALLCPGLVFSAAGLIADGAFTSAEGGTGLSASGNPDSVLYFNHFIRQFPTLVAGFKVSTSNIGQFEQNLSIQKQSPFQKHESKVINVAIHASEANPNTTLITVAESFYMDSETVVSYPVLPSTTVNLGLIFGVSLKLTKALRSKTAKAKSNMAAAAIGR